MFLTIDGHADTVQRFIDEGWNFADPLNGGMLNLASARAGNLHAEFFALWVDPTEYPGSYARRTCELLDAVQRQVALQPQDLAFCTSAEDIEAAHRSGRFGVLLGIEGGHSLEHDLSLLERYFRLGVRYMTLTWSHSVGWADSSGDSDDTAVAHCGGLTSFGQDVIREMNRLGMMVDVSHVSDDTFAAVLATSTAPVIASHSSARALANSPRNLTDDQLQALAAQGGVAMVNFFPAFLDDDWRTGWNAQKPERDQAQLQAAAPYRAQDLPVPFHVSNAVDRTFAGRLPAVELHHVVAHLEHMVEVAGAEHVGLGSDFDGIPAAPNGLSTAADLPSLAQALLNRGHSQDTVAAIFGGNTLRVLTEVQRVAASR